VGSVTGRMPRPPPPATAFTIIAPPGPSALINTRASSSVVGPDVPSSTGTPQLSANRRAAALSPNRSRVAGRGPIKVSPASWHRRANVAFSARKPYPGCTESHPAASARAMICGASRYAAGPLPVSPMASSAARVCNERRSSSAYIVTALIPISIALRAMRMAISPRLAISNLPIFGPSAGILVQSLLWCADQAAVSVPTLYRLPAAGQTLAGSVGLS
jgi:hypothetical protein